VAVDERWYARSLAHRLAIDQDDVKADAELRQAARAFHCIGSGGSADHEACRAQYAALVRLFDGGVDMLAEAEIVGRDDEMLQ
jgi:hypothetical protein